MSTMNISFPDELKAFVDEQVAGRGYTSSSECVRELLRREQDREKLRGMLHEGLASGPAREIDLAAYGAELRARIKQRARQFEAAKGAARSRKPKANAR